MDQVKAPAALVGSAGVLAGGHAAGFIPDLGDQDHLADEQPDPDHGYPPIEMGRALVRAVSEVGGELQAAARGYALLASDDRLSGRDRARSRLWIGTALSKDGEHGHAARVMTEAAREFVDLSDAEDWSVAQQKLALAYRGAGNLAEAQRLITIAGGSGPTGTPMQKVRLSTAKAHILLSGTGTRGQGLALLDETARLAMDSGLSHQLRSIESIRTDALAEAR